MRATSLSSPIRSRVQQLSADASAAMARRHHEVLEPAAWPVPYRENIRVNRGQPDNAITLYGQQDIGIPVVDRIFETCPSALLSVSGCALARRLEQLLNQSEDRAFFLNTGRSDRYSVACWLLLRWFGSCRAGFLARRLQLSHLLRERRDDLLPVTHHRESR